MREEGEGRKIKENMEGGGKEKNFANTNLTPRRETRDGRGGCLPPPPLVYPLRMGVSFPFISQ